MNAYLDAMRRYFNFSGRSTRSQYWMFALAVILLGIIAIVLDAAVLGSSRPAGSMAVVYVVHLIPSIAVTVRRLHDADKRGWLILLLLIPLVNLICYVVFGCWASTPGTNRFGPPVGANAPDQATAAATAREPASTGTMVERLEKLTLLRASGTIDDAEFQRLKVDVMKDSGR
ncbi:DUF805 domain-containing protein [Neorhizobium galegae]|uniref:DUF805 domain-containing protein n=1 Tax=Neorhizobium galegae TaxID=399 RepID=UPI002100E0A9|nr:DUF805 domain-containing protein [Neorhizobium galegae]MCQ1573472.1 DUF805 domain-containing protein [Neorhizobium galegae]